MNTKVVLLALLECSYSNVWHNTVQYTYYSFMLKMYNLASDLMILRVFISLLSPISMGLQQVGDYEIDEPNLFMFITSGSLPCIAFTIYLSQ